MLQTSMASARYYREQGEVLLRWASTLHDYPEFAARLESLAHEYLSQASLLDPTATRGLQEEFASALRDAGLATG